MLRNKLALLLLGAFILRMMSLNMDAEADQPEIEQQSATPTSEQSDTGESTQPSTGFAAVVETANSGIDAAIYSRAHVLLTKAQESGDAALWLNEYRQQLTSDLQAKQKEAGVFDGDASKFATGINRTGEAAALALALLWLEQPESKEAAPAAYSLQSIISQLEQGGIDVE